MTYRNTKILRLANDIGYCTACGSDFMDGSIVAAHSNLLSDGKGRGLKASDYMVAYLCFQCHNAYDQHLREFSQAEWDMAWRKTIRWLFENGHIKIM